MFLSSAFLSELIMINNNFCELNSVTENEKKRSCDNRNDFDIDFEMGGSIKRLKRSVSSASLSSFEDSISGVNDPSGNDDAFDLNALDELIHEHESRTMEDSIYQQQQRYLSFQPDMLPPPAFIGHSKICTTPSTMPEWSMQPQIRSNVMEQQYNMAPQYQPYCLPVESSSNAAGVGKNRTKAQQAIPNNMKLPPSDDGPVAHHTQREIFQLATEEDLNWLSDFLHFVRSDVVEVFRASKKDVSNRSNSKKIAVGQVGIRCRFCSHLPQREKARRSATYPSSIDRIYQSVTMMIRDHMGRCELLPTEIRQKLATLKEKSTQGAIDSKKFWCSSAKQIGMVDTPKNGIIVTHQSRVAAQKASNEASIASIKHNLVTKHLPPLVEESDSQHAPEYRYTLLLLQQVKRAFLTQEEQIGNRRSMDVGLPGFSCKFCGSANRGGMSRFFPGRRRTLATKLHDLHDHLMRCTLCPPETKQKLQNLLKADDGIAMPESSKQREFLDQVWQRLQST